MATILRRCEHCQTPRPVHEFPGGGFSCRHCPPDMGPPSGTTSPYVLTTPRDVLVVPCLPPAASGSATRSPAAQRTLSPSFADNSPIVRRVILSAPPPGALQADPNDLQPIPYRRCSGCLQVKCVVEFPTAQDYTCAACAGTLGWPGITRQVFGPHSPSAAPGAPGAAHSPSQQLGIPHHPNGVSLTPGAIARLQAPYYMSPNFRQGSPAPGPQYARYQAAVPPPPTAGIAIPPIPPAPHQEYPGAHTPKRVTVQDLEPAERPVTPPAAAAPKPWAPRRSPQLAALLAEQRALQEEIDRHVAMLPTLFAEK